jgi:uncharacterized protein (TIGR02466 family)
MKNGYYINLSSSEERNNCMINEIKKAPYNINRFEGINGITDFKNSNNPSIKGNSASHINIWKNIKKDKNNIIHIMEDDCILSKDYSHHQNKIIFPEDNDWDIFLTDIFIPSYSGVYEIFEKELQAYEKNGQISIIDLSQIGFGSTTSYFINKKSVNKLLSLFEDESIWEEPIDHMLSNYVTNGKIKAYCCIPFITSFNSTAYQSTIRDNLSNIEQKLYELRKGFFIDSLNKEQSKTALLDSISLRIQNQTGIYQKKELLFPSPILIRHFELTKMLNNSLYDEICKLCNSENDGYRSTYGGLRSYQDFFVNPSYAMSELKMMIENSLSEYCNSFLAMMIKIEPNMNFNFKITPWAYLLSAGDFMKPHVHPDGFISGCYYVQVPQNNNSDEGAIVFEAPDYSRSLSNVPTTANNSTILRPKEGNLVLFPSYLPHYVIPFKEGNRAVIAFDIILEKN